MTRYFKFGRFLIETTNVYLFLMSMASFFIGTSAWRFMIFVDEQRAYYITIGFNKAPLYLQDFLYNFPFYMTVEAFIIIVCVVICIFTTWFYLIALKDLFEAKMIYKSKIQIVETPNRLEFNQFMLTELQALEKQVRIRNEKDYGDEEKPDIINII